MEEPIFYSYLSGAVAFGAVLISSFFQKSRNTPFTIATFFSLLWCLAIMRTSQDPTFFLADTMFYETIRNASWLFLLATLLSKRHYSDSYSFVHHHKYVIPLVLLTLFTASIETFPEFLDFIRTSLGVDPRFSLHVIFAVLGLILVEQLYRNTSLSHRWNIKFLCLGLGCVFAVDFLVFSKSLLYTRLDINLWQTRGVINAVVATLLIVARNRMNGLAPQDDLSAPRKTIFYTTILFGSGLYLILMSLTGFYLKHANAEWGETAQTFFIFLAILLLIISFTSGKIRALAKVYFSKHFFHYSYDYRAEWLKISKALAQLGSLNELKNFIITTLTELVESSGGGLWLKNDQGRFVLAAEQNLRLTLQEIEYLKTGHDLPQYLMSKQWVIDFFELAHAPEVYDDIDLSPWCYEDSQVWLIIPLFHLNHLEAFVVLTQARVARKLNWEDHDLLKTVGMQLANALALNRASEELAHNRQFETYHRLSAFLVHDLKNIAAQISLIVKNAAKHKHNPDFFDDTIDTLNNVVNKMQHMVEQLKHGQKQFISSTLVDLVDVVRNIKQQHIGSPPLQFKTELSECYIQCDKIKLTSIITNLVQNAQDATRDNPDGNVKLVLTKHDDHAVINLTDNGVGMDQNFISERLFKPFDTTKGNAGMGIGAYEARDYILKNGGTLAVESQLGKGTTFIIQLPLANQEHNEFH